MGAPILTVSGLSVEFRTRQGTINAVNGVDFELRAGETLGIVGESGSGKSVTAMAILGLLPRAARGGVAGSIELRGEELISAPEERLRDIRGKEIGLISQNPMSSLNPVHTVGRQIAEAIRLHERVGGDAAWARAVDLLSLVGVGNAETRAKQHPHEFSGGMRQRAMIAMAIANQPAILIADEPTTALDVTIQAQFLEMLKLAAAETGASTLLITHDLGVIAEMADRVAVMYAGRIVEIGEVGSIYSDPKHPYTVGLLTSLPKASGRRARLIAIPGSPPDASALEPGCAFHPRCAVRQGRTPCAVSLPELVEVHGTGHRSRCHFVDEVQLPAVAEVSIGSGIDRSTPMNGAEGGHARAASPSGPLLDVRDLRKYFSLRGNSILSRSRGDLKAVDGVSFAINEGETLGLVGESGCGKSTTGRAILRLIEPTSGTVCFAGTDIQSLSDQDLRAARREMQIVFQDPYGSLNRRMTTGDIISEPLVIHDAVANDRERRDRVAELLELVGLDAGHAERYPHEFSGGQRQRIVIARALALEPRLLVIDEPVSALDVSIQAQIINLLQDLQERLSLTYLLISHDLSVIWQLCNQVAVMYLGKIVELGDRESIYQSPQHPYTRALLSAVPVTDPSQRDRESRIILQGEIPSPVDPPSGCNFRTRCRKATSYCSDVEPQLLPTDMGASSVACHYPGDADPAMDSPRTA